MNSLRHAREILFHLVYRDVKLRYKNSVLGFFWSFLNPLMQVVFITIAFKYILLRGNAPENLSLLLLLAYFPWMFFNQALQDSADTVQQNDELIKKVKFPRELLPLGELVANGFHFVLSLLVLAGVFIALHVSPHWEMLPLALLCFIIQLVLMYGLMLMLAPLSAFYNDVRFLLQAMLSLWFWILPIIHQRDNLAELPRWFQQVYLLNPLSPVILGYRSLLDGPPSSAMSDYNLSLLIAAGVAALFLFAGRAVFYHFEWRLPER